MKEYIRLMPQHLQEIYCPELKKKRAQKEQQMLYASKLKKLAQAAAFVVDKENVSLKLSPAEKSALLQGRANDGHAELFVSIIRKACKVNSNALPLARFALDTVRGHDAVLARELMRTLKEVSNLEKI